MEDEHFNFGFKRSFLEVIAAVLAAAPVGMFLYFGPVLVWAILFHNLLVFLALLVPTIGSSIATWMNFSPGMLLLLAAVAVAMEAWSCRMLVGRHHSVFAYTQAMLALAVSSPFFYWSIVHQKPMLPFWGQ